jgi:hypothetical protein
MHAAGSLVVSLGFFHFLGSFGGENRSGGLCANGTPNHAFTFPFKTFPTTSPCVVFAAGPPRATEPAINAAEAISVVNSIFSNCVKSSESEDNHVPRDGTSGYINDDLLIFQPHQIQLTVLRDTGKKNNTISTVHEPRAQQHQCGGPILDR